MSRAPFSPTYLRPADAPEKAQPSRLRGGGTFCAGLRPQTPQHRASLLRHSRAQFEAFPGAGAWRGGLQLRGKVLSPGRPFLLPQWSSGIQPYLLTAWTSRPLDWSKHTYGLTHTHTVTVTHTQNCSEIFIFDLQILDLPNSLHSPSAPEVSPASSSKRERENVWPTLLPRYHP